MQQSELKSLIAFSQILSPDDKKAQYKHIKDIIDGWDTSCHYLYNEITTLCYALFGDSVVSGIKYKNKWERISLLYMYLMYANNIDVLPEWLIYDGWQTDLL